MNIFLIIVGYIIWLFAARGFSASGGQQELGSGLITLIAQIFGIGLIIWGVVGLLS